MPSGDDEAILFGVDPVVLLVRKQEASIACEAALTVELDPAVGRPAAVVEVVAQTLDLPVDLPEQRFVSRNALES